MLYVFQMDIGQMLTFDISLLMDSMARLQVEIAKATGISVDKQILLVSGGHSLKHDQKVMTYGAGADTNPVFLFSKLAIENQDAPLVRSMSVSKDSFGLVKEQVTEAINLPANFDTVTKRTKIACQIRDAANKILGFCNNEFKEQHLQYQGWGTVVANLEEIAQALQKTQVKFNKAIAVFLPQRENHFAMLKNFSDVLELLDRIPLLQALNVSDMEGETSIKKFGLRGSMSHSRVPKSLLDWISNQGQGQSLDAHQKQCFDELVHFDSELFESCDRQVQDLLTLVVSDPHQMKELVGIERRLSELEKRLNEAKKIAKEQSDMAQGFLNHQSRLNSTQDAASILPDLCTSHKQQLVQMIERHQRLEALQNNFRKSKQEMSKNIHQRLGWVMHIETLVSKLDSELIYHMKTLRLLDCNLELLNQVKAAPQVYAMMVVEAARRKLFSHVFSQWAETLAKDSSHLYKLETERRKLFAKKLGEHFLLDTLFKGFDDIPPNFATKPPEPFDLSLPDITVDDIVLLKNSVPELEEPLSLPLEPDLFSYPLLYKSILRSSFTMGVPHSQSSQTEWSHNGVTNTTAPCVITATETPAYSFTVPETFGSPKSSDYMTTIAPLNREVLTSSNVEQTEKEAADPDQQKDSQSAVSSLNVADSSSSELPVKAQSKVNSDSTSPISSNEFATADFYFEDAMPSPMADSPLGKKEKKNGDVGKTDIELITSLHAELAEKRLLIQELEQQLRKKEALLLEYGKCDTKETGSEGSSTLVVTVDHLSSSDISPLVSGSGKVNDNSEKESDQWKFELDTTNCELSKLRTVLLETENKLDQVQQRSDEVFRLKENLISDLENSLKSLSNELSDSKARLTNIETEKEDLEKRLNESLAQCESQEIELRKGEETLLSIRNKLKHFHNKVKTDIPSLSQNLLELRTAVANNKSELQSSMSLALATVEKEVSTFNATIQAAACGGFRLEKDALNNQIDGLKASQEKTALDSSETITQLKSANDNLSSELEQQQLEYNERLAQQKVQFETTIKDMETKHALEVELELDRCRAELKENEETAEKNIESFKQKYQEVMDALDKLKITSEEEKAHLLRSHTKLIEECETKHAEDKALMAQTFEEELTRKDMEQTRQKAEFKDKLESIHDCLATENINALANLRKELISESERQLLELRQQQEEQKENYSKLLEEKQLDHAEKLTLLKTQFDMERDILQGEVNRYKNRELSDACTQLDTDLVSEIMTNSETQTGLELLAEVISLTSSASYGSEEMIPHKVQCTNVDEKDNKDCLDLSKLQQINEDLNIQLVKAQDKVNQLKEEVAALQLKEQELCERISSGTEQRNEMKQSMNQAMQTDLPRCPDLMQTSVSTSIMVMDRELSFETATKGDQDSSSSEQEAKAKDEKIAQLEKKLKDLRVSKSRDSASDKVSIRRCDRGDLVLLCLDERHDHYVVCTVGTNLHFLHSESLECLGLQLGADVCRKSWILAEVVDKEFFSAKKPKNRFRVPQGTRFYLVKCKPWRSDIELSRTDISRHTIKSNKQDNTVTAVKEKT